MKKLCVLALLSTLIYPQADAAVQVVQVDSSFFNPSSFIINVGDTVMWIWATGVHTTTSTSVPGGAATWDQPIDNSSPSFSYQATVAGGYDYECTYHATMGMVASFTVLGTAGVPASAQGSPLSFVNISGNGQLSINFNHSKSVRAVLNI